MVLIGGKRPPCPLAVFQPDAHGVKAELAGNEHGVLAKGRDVTATGTFHDKPAGLGEGILDF